MTSDLLKSAQEAEAEGSSEAQVPTFSAILNMLWFRCGMGPRQKTGPLHPHHITFERIKFKWSYMIPVGLSWAQWPFGSLCEALWNDKWYEATVQGHTETGVLVKYTDYDDVVEVNMDVIWFSDVL
eukprot:1189534-Prorocentrum_minimum.AAC.2